MGSAPRNLNFQRGPPQSVSRLLDTQAETGGVADSPQKTTYNRSHMSTPIQDIPVRRINGEDTNLGEYSGKVLLIVNVASKCGLTKQYEGLEKLYRNYRDRGLVVAGFPANDFKAQEPGSNEEIASFCSG